LFKKSLSKSCFRRPPLLFRTTPLGERSVHVIIRDKRTTQLSLVAAVAAVIVSVTLDSARQTQVVGALEICRRSAL